MIPALSSAPVPATAPATAAPASTSRDSEIDKAAKGMEGIFMSMLANEMFKGTEIATAQPVYGGLMIEKFGDQLAAQGGIGLAAVLARQLGGES